MACSTGSSAESSDTDSDPEVDPTTITDDYWVWVEGPDEIRSSQKTLGKWLVFKRFDKLDETWHMIRKAVDSGELGAIGAKCSTACAVADPSSNTMDPSTGVICVYTSKETMDEVGFKLIRMVKQDIRYKTDEATLKGEYIATGYKKVTVKTIFWNNGEPGFTKTLTRRRRGEANHYPNALSPRVDPPTKPPYTVYLGNLSFECTEDDILEFFEKRNINVLSVRLPLESRTNRPRGFGYAELENTEAVMEALSLSQEPLRGRRLYVDIPAQEQVTVYPSRHRYDHTMGNWRPRMRHEGERSLPPQDSQGGYHYRERRGYDHGPPQRYQRGSHHRDPYGDRGPPQRYDEGHHHRDPYGDHGPPRRYDEGHDHRDPYGDRGPPRRYDEGHDHHDPYGDHGLPRRYDEGRYYHGHYGSDAQQRSLEDHREWGRRRDEQPKERPRLQLQSRTKPPEDTSGRRERGEGGRASSSIFGQAKPVDTAARDREIEERLLRERAEWEEMGDRSLTDEGGKRGGRRNESRQRERTDRRGRYDSGGRGERGERGDRSDQGERGGRGDRSGRGERGGWYDRSERGERRGRHDSGGQRERGERSDSSDRGERRDGNCSPHDGCHDTTEATGWGGRRRESHEEEEKRASEPGRGRGNDDPASPTKK